MFIFLLSLIYANLILLKFEVDNIYGILLTFHSDVMVLAYASISSPKKNRLIEYTSYDIQSIRKVFKATSYN
jgi:hypothetical protein